MKRWYIIAEVNGAYKHSRYEKNLLYSLLVISIVEVSVMQDSQPDGQTNMSHYINP